MYSINNIEFVGYNKSYDILTTELDDIIDDINNDINNGINNGINNDIKSINI
jgi:hypothetical protein